MDGSQQCIKFDFTPESQKSSATLYFTVKEVSTSKLTFLSTALGFSTHVLDDTAANRQALLHVFDIPLDKLVDGELPTDPEDVNAFLHAAMQADHKSSHDGNTVVQSQDTDTCGIDLDSMD